EPEFSEEELDAAVKQMKNGKAPGHDGVKIEVVKRMYARIKRHLMFILYNRMLAEGRFPSVWKKGETGLGTGVITYSAYVKTEGRSIRNA
ncbi:hypothetical protein J6590_098863, partial [Homalodisca vitripennis]